jgi:hypothetical protein
MTDDNVEKKITAGNAGAPADTLHEVAGVAPSVNISKANAYAVLVSLPNGEALSPVDDGLTENV